VCRRGTNAGSSFVTLNEYLQRKSAADKKLYQQAHERLTALMTVMLEPVSVDTGHYSGEETVQLHPYDRGPSVRWVWVRYDTGTKSDVLEVVDYDIHMDSLEREVARLEAEQAAGTSEKI